MNNTEKLFSIEEKAEKTRVDNLFRKKQKIEKRIIAVEKKAEKAREQQEARKEKKRLQKILDMEEVIFSPVEANLKRMRKESLLFCKYLDKLFDKEGYSLNCERGEGKGKEYDNMHFNEKESDFGLYIATIVSPEEHECMCPITKKYAKVPYGCETFACDEIDHLRDIILLLKENLKIEVWMRCTPNGWYITSVLEATEHLPEKQKYLARIMKVTKQLSIPKEIINLFSKKYGLVN